MKVDGNVWDLSTKVSYPMGDRFSPYGRLGWSYTDIRGVFTENSIEGRITERVNDYDDAFSGMRLIFNKHAVPGDNIATVDRLHAVDDTNQITCGHFRSEQFLCRGALRIRFGKPRIDSARMKSDNY